jgi:hypothetical protein
MFPITQREREREKGEKMKRWKDGKGGGVEVLVVGKNKKK